MEKYLINKCVGMVRAPDTFNLDPKYAIDLLNCYSDDMDGVQQRYGTLKVTTTAPINSGNSKVRRIQEVLWANGVKDLICRAYDGWYKVGVGFTALDAGRTADERGQMCMFDNYLIMTDGGKARKSNQGYTVTDLSSDAALPAHSTACHTHRGRVILNEKGTMKVLISKVNDPFGAAAYSTVGDSITLNLQYILPEWDEPIAFTTVTETLLAIIGTKYITIYDVPELTANIKIYRYIECNPVSPDGIKHIANDTVIGLEGGLNFLSSTQAFERVKIGSLSDTIEPFWMETMLSQVNKQDICMCFNHSLSHLYITFHSTGGSQTLVFGLRKKRFIGRFEFPWKVYSWCEKSDGTIIMGADDGNVYRLNSAAYSDDSQAMRFEYQIPYLGGENPDAFKSPREAELMIQANQSVNVYLDYWFGLSDTPLDSKRFTVSTYSTKYRAAKYRASKYRGGGRKLVLNPNLKNRGKFIGIKIRHNDTGVRVRIPYFYIKYKLEGKK